MSKDGYIPSDGNAGDLAVGERSVTGGGGGGATGRENFHDSGTSFAEGIFGQALAWILDGFPGDDLLDLTDPAAPFVKQAGVYAVQVDFDLSSSGAGDPASTLTLVGDLDYAGPSPEMGIALVPNQHAPLAVVCHFAAGSHLGLTFGCPAGVGVGGGGAQWRGVVERLS